MPGEPNFMAVRGPGIAVLQAEPATAARVTTNFSKDRRIAARQPVEFNNPALAAAKGKIRPHFGLGIETRDQVKVPISPFPEPVDTSLFQDPADGTKKLYLPRYRLREQGGRYEIGIAASQDGGWQLSLGLERFPAPELGAGAQGAGQLPHTIAVFFLYGAGPSNAIEKRVDFTERADDAKGVTVSVRLTLSERDNLLHALQTAAAAPRLVVRRAITVAVKIPDQKEPPTRPVLIRNPRVPIMEAQPMLAARPQRVQMAAARPLAKDAVLNAQLIHPPLVIHPPVVIQPQPVDRYRTVQRALDDVADPEPFVLDPLLHPYLYEGAAVGGGGGAAASEFRRIVLAHPQGSPDARFHAYLQDKGEPWVFYYLPDRFKLARRDVAPFLPQMVVRIAAPDGTIENVSVTVDYVVEPSLDAGRLKAAAAALRREIPAATSQQTEPELRPLQAKATLQLWVPGANGAALSEMTDVAIDLANGFLHSLTLPLDGFRQLYGAAYSLDATSLFSGQVLVETGLSTPEPIPVEIRFADTQGEILSFAELPSETEATVAVRLQNSIESPVRLSSLPVRVHRGDQEVAAAIEGVDFQTPVDLAPGAELSFTVRPQGELTGEGPLDVIFDTSGVEILPDPETILPLISDQSVPAQYEREIEVMTLPELLGDITDPAAILLINVEFKGGGSLKLTREQTSGMAQVRLPLMDLLLGRDVQGKYGFRQQIIRRNGERTADSDWREADFSLLVLPIA